MPSNRKPKKTRYEGINPDWIMFWQDQLSTLKISLEQKHGKELFMTDPHGAQKLFVLDEGVPHLFAFRDDSKREIVMTGEEIDSFVKQWKKVRKKFKI